MQLAMSCPKCSKGAILTLDEEQRERIKKAILEEGRSPTLLTTCEGGHELIVTLYFRDDEFGVRDIAVPLETKPEKKSKGKMSEMDWVKSTFGG